MTSAKSKKTPLLIIFLLLIAGTASAYFYSRINKKPNILVIVIDTLRADHLGYNGYERDTSPNIDKFAKENLIFKNAMSTSDWTPPSIASMFTGFYPTTHGMMPPKSEDKLKVRSSKVPAELETLAEVLQKNGYTTNAVLANPWVGDNYGFAQGFDNFKQLGRNASARKVTGHALRFLETLKDGDKPFFLYLHYMDVHFPYKPKEGFDVFQGPLKSREYPPKQVKFIARYDGEIKYVDYKVEEVLAWLKAQGMYDDLVIVLTADHGEQFTERGYQGHADRLFSEEIHIPLILKANGKQGEENTPVSLVDLFPTLLELAKIQLPYAVHGFSLLSELEKRQELGVLSEVVRHYNLKSHLHADGKKYIAEYHIDDPLIRKDLNGAIKEQVFDLNADPREMSPLQDNLLLEKMRAWYGKYYQDILNLREPFTPGGADVDKEMLKELKTLGYF